MSSSYVSEPNSQGKAVIVTKSGPLELELWSREAPQACQRFLQLAMDGFYDGLTFDRLSPGFLIQCTAPPGKCTDDELKVEVHSRIKWNRRGLVGLADARAGFFISLEKATELTGRHTCFGKIVGDTLFNVLNMAEQEVDENECPVYPPEIIRIEIIDNPFEHLHPRVATLPKKEPKERQETKTNPKRNIQLLSFSDDDEEAPDASRFKKFKSSHDLGDDGRLSKEAISIDGASIQSPSTKEAQADRVPTSASAASGIGKDQDGLSLARKSSSESQMTKIREEIAELTAELRDRGKSVHTEGTSKKTTGYVDSQRDLFLGGKKKATSAGRVRTAKSNEDEVLASLKRFHAKITAAKARSVGARKVPDDDEGPLCTIHHVPGCASCTRRPADDRIDDAYGDTSWMGSELRFKKDRLGKDLVTGRRKEDDEGYVVIDPRAKQKV